jgi:uncharacterized lipoprotein
MRFGRVLTAVAAVASLSGCHWLRSSDCHSKQEYQRAVSAPPLKVPAGLDSPNTQGALVIPTVELTPPPPGPKDTCLDIPPRYKPAPTNKAGSSG